MDRHRIVVVGAGYAGLAAARTAAARTRPDQVEVTVVNPHGYFVERVRMHQVAAGQPAPVHPLAETLAGTGVGLVVARVHRLDPEARTVHATAADGPLTLTYDTLVHAPGSTTDTTTVPGVAEHAHTLAELDTARRTADRVARSRTPRIAVVGGGLTGVETAAELAETHPGARVLLLTRDRLAPGVSRRGRGHLRRVLHRIGVDVREHTDVTAVHAHGLDLADGTALRTDVVVWAAGFRAPVLAAEAGIAVDERGRVVVDATQRSVSHADVYAVGDAARAAGPDGRALRMACATGLPMGTAAGRAIAARLAGRPAPPLRFRYRIRCVSLGWRDGLVQFVDADDAPREVVLTGRPAALVKEAVVRGAALTARRLSGPSARRRCAPGGERSQTRV
ncbi:FAD-dependent oxidoreductase [Thermobifida alba]|uniref:FAD-dependent oxidoreductase n=1 Tax=Thermobifida alba TaxID=53522 RepID=A0ABY4L3G2_THEAE|nr:FAD-dependent oxidoreductase [Thermobifida alba]UPT20853.1 FAD-dependent oxidoreductase [Thermobifida alba]